MFFTINTWPIYALFLDKTLKWTFGCPLLQIYDLFIVYDK